MEAKEEALAISSSEFKKKTVANSAKNQPITYNSRQTIMSQRIENLGYCGLILLLAIFPVYSALVNGAAHQHLEHHLSFLKGNSVYFNPWQYRVLSPILVEGFHRFLNFSLYSWLPVSDVYNSSFKLFRVLQHLLIFGFAWYFYRYFTFNRPLRFLAITMLAGAFSAAAYGSDMAFNTYFDVLFYLVGAWLIFSDKSRWWLVPLTLVAALNRETSLLLPLLLVLDFKKLNQPVNRKKYFLIFSLCLVVFAAVFISVRLYYGYQAPAYIGIETGWPILKFNLTDPETVLQLFDTLGVLPLFVLFNLRKTEFRLQMLFWLLVPAWFAAHFWLVWARETRIFLVPLVIVFIPVILSLIRISFEKNAGKQPA